MTRFSVSPSAACGAHEWLAKRAGPLAALVALSRAALPAGRVHWHAVVTSTTVYRVESLHRVAEDEGFELLLTTDGTLAERECAFFDDYYAHRIESRARSTWWTQCNEAIAGIGEALDAMYRQLIPTRRETRVPNQLRSVVIIGAYGGDHIGDAAILGGVLLTLRERYGVAAATVMSHRAEHTRRLVAGLSRPMDVTVAPYTGARVARLLDDADALVLAGGPVVDLPRVLAKHLSSANAARARGKPFLVERIGIGGFQHAVSRWAARRTFALASSVSVRSSDSRGHALLGGREASVGRDPAFDYLERRATLDKLDAADTKAIDSLLADTAGATLVGINLRPVSDAWHPRGPSHSAALRTSFTMAFADALAQYAATAAQRVVFVFFPMNAIQFGMSDLTAAYDLQRCLGGRAELRVWEADPQVDGTLYLLRRLTAAVVMRLHAAVFAFSQGVPTCGVDYFSGMDRKLTQLFADQGRTDQCCTMEAFDARWLVSWLQVVVSADGGAQTARGP